MNICFYWGWFEISSQVLTLGSLKCCQWNYPRFPLTSIKWIFTFAWFFSGHWKTLQKCWQLFLGNSVITQPFHILQKKSKKTTFIEFLSLWYKLSKGCAINTLQKWTLFKKKGPTFQVCNYLNNRGNFTPLSRSLPLTYNYILLECGLVFEMTPDQDSDVSLNYLWPGTDTPALPAFLTSHSLYVTLFQWDLFR